MPTPLDLAYLTALAAASPWLAWRAARTGRYRRDLAAKLLGRVPPLPRSKAMNLQRASAMWGVNSGTPAKVRRHW